MFAVALALRRRVGRVRGAGTGELRRSVHLPAAAARGIAAGTATGRCSRPAPTGSIRSGTPDGWRASSGSATARRLDGHEPRARSASCRRCVGTRVGRARVRDRARGCSMHAGRGHRGRAHRRASRTSSSTPRCVVLGDAATCSASLLAVVARACAPTGRPAPSMRVLIVAFGVRRGRSSSLVRPFALLVADRARRRRRCAPARDAARRCAARSRDRGRHRGARARAVDDSQRVRVRTRSCPVSTNLGDTLCLDNSAGRLRRLPRAAARVLARSAVSATPLRTARRGEPEQTRTTSATRPRWAIHHPRREAVLVVPPRVLRISRRSRRADRPRPAPHGHSRRRDCARRSVGWPTSYYYVVLVLGARRRVRSSRATRARLLRAARRPRRLAVVPLVPRTA